MNEMYNIIKQVIESRNYNLSDFLGKIEKRCLEGSITEEQKDELITLANENADPEKSNAPEKHQIEAIFKNLGEMGQLLQEVIARVTKLENGESAPEETPEETVEYKEWYRHNGIGLNPWQDGSICTHNERYWLSHVPDNVWEPGALGVYDNIWEDITDKVMAEQDNVTEEETK